MSRTSTLSPDPDLTPQPGAVKGNFEANGLPKADVTNPSDPSWPRLPAEQAPNFVTASPLLISYKPKETGVSPTPLFRVWGEPAWDIGRYWTLERPATNVEFYGGVAVEYGWNSGRYVAQLVTAGAVTTIQAWLGPTARQPAMGIHGDGRPPEILAGYYLPGETTQICIPDGTLPYLSDQRTPWNVDTTHKAGRPTAASPTVTEPLSPERLPGAMKEAGYVNLVAAVLRLSGLLRQLDHQASILGPRLAAMSALLTGQAIVLERRLQALNVDLPNFQSDREATTRVTALLWSLVATGRHVDGDFSWSGQSAAIDQAVRDVVFTAYDLAQAPK